MKPSLQLRLSQQLALTPQLQQSIRLLQLSTLELNQEIERVLAENPLLERLDDPMGECVRLAPSGSIEPAPSAADPRSDAMAAERAERAGEDVAPDERAPADDAPAPARDDEAPLDVERIGDWSGEPGARGRDDDDDDEYPLRQVAASTGSLKDHLLEQLAATRCTPRDRALVTLLIDELNDDGYLGASLEEVAAMLPAELEIEPQEISAALNMLRSFEPTGVGAHHLAECLLLQLDAQAPATPDPVHEAARAIVEHHLSLLAARDFVKIKRALHCSDDVLRDAQALIRALNPRPGAAYGEQKPTYVVPDVIVRRTRSGWIATLNPDVMPRLRIHDVYAQILRRQRNGNAGLSSQLQEARWLIKNVQQRFDTILRVAQAIVERQRAFFSHGEVAMRPLVLREIADALGLHESTVSRVTTQKFMLTPYGTFELKYFFGSHVATDAGGAASSTAIRAIIKQLVTAEDSRNPLSDSRIAELLGEQGIMVARRTVAKYRDALRIPAVAQRKSL